MGNLMHSWSLWFPWWTLCIPSACKWRLPHCFQVECYCRTDSVPSKLSSVHSTRWSLRIQEVLDLVASVLIAFSIGQSVTCPSYGTSGLVKSTKTKKDKNKRITEQLEDLVHGYCAMQQEVIDVACFNQNASTSSRWLSHAEYMYAGEDACYVSFIQIKGQMWLH